MESLAENISAKQIMANNCLWNISGNDITLIWCFDSNDLGGLNGQEGDLNPNFGCDDWVYFNPDGIGKCIRTRSCVDSNGNIYSTTEYGVECNGNVVHGNDEGGNDEGNNDNNGGNLDDNWGIEDGPVNDGPVNGGLVPNNNEEEEEIVPVNPPVDYVKAAELCLGFFGDNYNIPQDAMEDLGKYTYENSCNDPFVYEAIDALKDNDNDGNPDGKVDFEEKIIYLLEDYPCQSEIIKDALEANSPVTDLVMDIFNSDVKPSITIQADNLNGILEAGNTQALNGNPLHYFITMNTQRLDVSTDIDIASTAIHESVHALLFYFLQAGSFQSENESYAQLVEDFVTYWVPNGGNGSPEIQHQYMQNLVSNIADSLYNWALNNDYNPGNFAVFDTVDTNNFDGMREYFGLIAWNGLTDKDAFKELYPLGTLSYMNALQIINSESFPYEYNANPQGEPCN